MENRRDFLLGALAMGLFPGAALAGSSDKDFVFEREYGFDGVFSVKGDPLDVYGNMSFNIRDGEYKAKIESFREGEQRVLYSMDAEGKFENGELSPRRTAEEVYIDIFLLCYPFSIPFLSFIPIPVPIPVFVNNRTILNYERAGDGVHIHGQVEKFRKGGIWRKTSPKERWHNSPGLDYISSVLKLLLDARDGIDTPSLNLLSGTGKLRKQEIVVEKIERGRRILLNHEGKSLSSIALELDEENELKTLSFSQGNSGLEADIVRRG